MTYRQVCSHCFGEDFEYQQDGEIIPDWLIDARKYLLNWDEAEEPGLLKWQDRKDYSDEYMQVAVDGLINSGKQSGPRAKGYSHPHRAIKTWVNEGYGRPKEQSQTNGYQRYPKKAKSY